MCRMLAYLGPPRTLEKLLLHPSESLVKQAWAPQMQTSGVVNADGFGVGWYARSYRPEPARYRSDRPIWADRSLESIAGVIESDAVLAAVRSATPPLPVEESGAPPFVSGRWMGVLNGFVTGFRGAGGERLRRLLTAERAGTLEGVSDAEVLFGLFMDRVDAGNDPVAALGAVVALVTDRHPGSSLNLMVTDGEQVLATVVGNSLWRLVDESEQTPSSVLASEPFDASPGWRRIQDGSLVRARAGKVRVTTLPVGLTANGRAGQARRIQPEQRSST